MANAELRGNGYAGPTASRRKERPACSDEPGIAVFVEDDVPFAALECVEREVYLVDGEIGYPAGAQDDDLVSVFSAAAGRQTDVLRVGGDDELQIPADNASHLARASVESLHVVVGQHVMPLPRPQALSAVLRRSVFSSLSSCS